MSEVTVDYRCLTKQLRTGIRLEVCRFLYAKRELLSVTADTEPSVQDCYLKTRGFPPPLARGSLLDSLFTRNERPVRSTCL